MVNLGRGRRKTFVVNGLLIAGGTLLAVLLAEGVVALLAPQKVLVTAAAKMFFVKYDPMLGWVNREGAAGVYQAAEGIPGAVVEVNAQGMRGASPSPRKKEGASRIIVLGDSNTFGYGVQNGQRFTDIAAGILGPKAELLNFGVFGYGTDQESLLLEREGFKYQPDVVLLAVSAGDLSDNMSSINGGVPKPYYKLHDDALTLKNTPVPTTLPYLRSRWARSGAVTFLHSHSHLFRLLVTRMTPVSRYMMNTVPEMSTDEALRVTIALIERMRDLCTENHARFAVVLIPHGIWLDGARRQPGAPIGYYPPLQMALSGLGIDVADASDALLREDKADAPVFFGNDPVHLTPRGNEVVARVVADFIARRRLLQKLPAGGSEQR